MVVGPVVAVIAHPFWVGLCVDAGRIFADELKRWEIYELTTNSGLTTRV
jgi:hypothetical protein